MYKLKYLSLLIILLMLLSLAGPSLNVSARPQAATDPGLGAATSFSVLAALSMSAAGAGTTVSGDLGLSPGLAVSRTGPWTVGGTEYFGPAPSLSADAQTAALGAFNNLAGQTSNGPWSASPWSPVPGVWTDAGSPVFAGTITLTGGYDDVWVFQISTDFTFSGAVVLAGNAQACHVYWQVARDATIASGSSFVGTLIASRDVTLASGANVNGRIISLNSSLTTDGNTIITPPCLAAPTNTPTATATVTNTPLPAIQTVIAATQTVIAATQTVIAATQTARAATRTAIVATLGLGTPSVTPAPPRTTPINGLPPTGGAPIRNESFPWSLLIGGGFSAIALFLGVRAYRRTLLSKK